MQSEALQVNEQDILVETIMETFVKEFQVIFINWENTLLGRVGNYTESCKSKEDGPRSETKY